MLKIKFLVIIRVLWAIVGMMVVGRGVRGVRGGLLIFRCMRLILRSIRCIFVIFKRYPLCMLILIFPVTEIVQITIQTQIHRTPTPNQAPLQQSTEDSSYSPSTSCSKCTNSTIRKTKAFSNRPKLMEC